MNILAAIPARGGSKGIPRKNIRLMHKKPLIYYAIHNAQSCAAITDVAVSTDDEEIAAISARYGAEVLARDAELARDATTLDPVIYDATLQMEAKRGISYDHIAAHLAVAQRRYAVTGYHLLSRVRLRYLHQRQQPTAPGLVEGGGRYRISPLPKAPQPAAVTAQLCRSRRIFHHQAAVCSGRQSHGEKHLGL